MVMANDIITGISVATNGAQQGGAVRRRVVKPFTFNGSAGEYFKIWIVNVLLSIITLGIYSAWAKVRSKRYFYSSTIVDGHAFEYLAKPKQILIGRLIAGAVLIVYVVVSNAFPGSEIAFFVLFIVALPWLIRRSLTFNARFSAYRNIRFDFKDTLGAAILNCLVWPLLAFLSLGLLYPFMVKQWKSYVLDHSRYGVTPFQMKAPMKEFYIYHFIVLCFLVGVGLLIWFLGTKVFSESVSVFLSNMSGGNMSATGTNEIPTSTVGFIIAAMTAMYIVFALVFLFVRAFLTAEITNLVWNNTRLANHRFHSTLKTSKLFWLFLSNALAIMLSVGLLIPWAKVRMARYRVEQYQLLVSGDLNNFVGAEQEKVSAMGQELGDFLDVDVGL